jgi:quercetin dioxygenase-like cupin family protein
VGAALTGLVALDGRADVGQEATAAVDQVVQSYVRRHYTEFRGCFERSLAEDRNKSGTIFVSLTLGPGGKVSKTATVRDELNHLVTRRCVLNRAQTHQLPGAAGAGLNVGDKVIVPLSFKADPSKFWVDVGALRSSNGEPPEKTGVWPILTEKNVGARRALLDLLVTRDEVALAPYAGDRVLVVSQGPCALRRMRQRASLSAGEVVWLPEREGAWRIRGQSARHAPCRALYFKIPRAGQDQPPRERSLRIKRGPAPLRLAGGRLSIVPLLDAKRMGHRRFYLGTLEALAGFTVPRHGHPTSAEVIVVLQGRGRTTVGEQEAHVVSSNALYIESATPHSLAVAEPMRALQLYVPAGPEERFFQAAKAGGRRRARTVADDSGNPRR